MHHTALLTQKNDKLRLKRVDADVIDQLIQKEDKPEMNLNEEEVARVTGVFEKAVNQDTMKVSVEALGEKELPVTVTVDEFMRRMKEMAQTGGGMSFYGNMPDNYKVTVNASHPLIQKLASSEGGEQSEDLAKQAFDLALLSRGLLTGKELTQFIQRSVGLIE